MKSKVMVTCPDIAHNEVDFSINSKLIGLYVYNISLK